MKTPRHPELVDDLQRQRDYVLKKSRQQQGGFGIVFADAFLRGIRDLGYKSPATALDELIDNSIQAGATLVDVLFGFRGKAESKPDQLAIIDNGHGMPAEMIRYAVAWGGTHRENDRSGFGRYGYGLPSSAVSLAKRYTVYSKEPAGSWHAVTIDLDELAAEASDGAARIPEPRAEEPPDYVRRHVLSDRTKKHAVASFPSGTVVVLEVLDRLPSGWVTTAVLRDKLRKHAGATYRHLMPATRIFIHGDPVEPVDPLFLMEAGRFFQETGVLAQAIKLGDLEVDAGKGEKGRVRLRAAFLPANFHLASPRDNLKGKKNSRLNIMQEHNGLLVCRAGRQIDCLSATPWTRFQNNDMHIKIEIDYDPLLDDFFGITTSKQQIVIAEAMWSRLEAAGLRKLIIDLRRELDKSMAAVEGAASSRRDTPRPSEQAMVEAERLKPRRVALSPHKTEQARDNLHNEAVNASEQTGTPLAQVLDALQTETADRPFKADFRAIPEGPFYRCERLGVQKRLIINTQHPFYAAIYNAPDATPEMQAALEVLLFVLADGELDAEGEFEEFYRSARQAWSIRLADALKKLDPDNRLSDKAAAIAEALEMSRGEEEEE
ncbi:MAG: ATP-binding protein [Gemmataceae bacterium]